MPCYLQSAIAGVDPDPRADCVWSAPCVIVMTNGSCAINGREPCQAGDRAALRSMFDVPQGSLSGARAAVNAYTVSFRVRCMVLTVYLAYFMLSETKTIFRRGDVAVSAVLRRLFINLRVMPQATEKEGQK